MKYEAQPFGYSSNPDVPRLELGKESIRLTVTEWVCSDGRVELQFHAEAMFPAEVAWRYHSLGEALVLVVNDVDQHDGFAVRTYNAFIRFVNDRTVNLKSPPALPLPSRGSLQSKEFQGAFVNGVVSFETVPPVHSPSVFLYLVLENYVSNVVGLDLVDCPRRATSPAPSRAVLPGPPPWEEGLEAVLEAGRLRLTYRLARATSERLKLPPVQGTVVVAINSYTQLPICRPLSAGTSLEWTGPVAIDGGEQWTASVDPLELLVLGQASGLWFLHASMMQYRSAVLALELGG